MIQEFPVWVYAQKKLKQGLKTSICTPTFIIALWWLPGTRGMAAWGGWGLNVYWAPSFSVEKDENILNVYSGDGWTMLMSLMPLNWTLKNG